MLEVNKIHNGDCLELMKEIPDKSIDLVLTDPPYGINVYNSVYKNRGEYRSKNSKARNGNYKPCEWDKDIPCKDIFEHIFRVSKHQIIFGGNYFIEYLHNSPCWLVWDKNNGTTDFADCELAWTNFKSSVRKYLWTWNGMLQHDMKNKDVRIHPTQKPLKLFEMILNDYSNENDLILDCFSGSGTTAIACHNLKRRFICIEKDYDYWKASCERLENTKAQLKLF